ncbi:LOW QUALITY PROTEIN: DUF862 domain-containing protein, partial [Cephalotus follicularis]
AIDIYGCCRDGEGNSETQVVLNVYDLYPINHYMSWFGFGIFHSGLEIHVKEYGFGAHDFPVSGVFEVEPRSCPSFIFRCSVPIVCIKMSPSEYRSNHFTDDISWRLTGKHIPGWVNRLA